MNKTEKVGERTAFLTVAEKCLTADLHGKVINHLGFKLLYGIRHIIGHHQDDPFMFGEGLGQKPAHVSQATRFGEWNCFRSKKKNVQKIPLVTGTVTKLILPQKH